MPTWRSAPHCGPPEGTDHGPPEDDRSRSAWRRTLQGSRSAWRRALRKGCRPEGRRHIAVRL